MVRDGQAVAARGRDARQLAQPWVRHRAGSGSNGFEHGHGRGFVALPRRCRRGSERDGRASTLSVIIEAEPLAGRAHAVDDQPVGADIG